MMHLKAGSVVFAAYGVTFFLQGGIAEDVAFVLHMNVLVHVSYINLIFNILINLLYICMPSTIRHLHKF